MIHCDHKNLYKKQYLILWSTLSFKAGFINAAGFLATGNYVSHVTGFGTQVGISLGNKNFIFGLSLSIIPITFILGGVITSFILDRKYSKDQIPNYPAVQCIVTLLLALITFLGASGYLNKDISPIEKYQEILLIALMCLICGLKNSLTTWATGGVIRTTHITGLSTDIGLNFLKIFRKKSHNSRYPEKRRINWYRALILICFSLGSCISAITFPGLGYKIFIIPFLISVILLIISIFHRKKMMRTIKTQIMASP